MAWGTPITLYGTIDTPRGPAPSSRPQRAGSMTWAALVALLAAPQVHPHKALAGAWSPVRLSAPRRLSSNVEAVGCLVLDVDGGTPIEAAREAWAHVRHALHTSYSHAPDRPRYRVVVPLARQITAAEHRDLWRWAHARWPAADRSARDAARAYYLPCIASPDAAWEHYHHDGPLLDPADCPPPPRRRPRHAIQRGQTYSDPAAEAARLLRGNPDARRAWATQCGAEVVSRPVGEVARGVKCPSCGDASVWWLIDPDRATHARCHHLDSCGWTGPLTDLA